MPSQILPITVRPSETPASATAAMLIKTEIENDDPTTSLLISSEYEDEEKAIKPLLTTAASYNTYPTALNTAANYYQHRRRRCSSRKLTQFSLQWGVTETVFKQGGGSCCCGNVLGDSVKLEAIKISRV